jgi:diketogulonate reductase-like aldo/keto reductase
LSEIASRYSRTPRQVALNFLTRKPNLYTIPKAGNLNHIRENSDGAGQWELSDEDISTIERIFPLPTGNNHLEMI